MSGLISILIPVRDGVPHIPEEYSSLDASGARERETILTQHFYAEQFRVIPGLDIYYSYNEMIIQFARDCARDQTLQFVYSLEDGKWLFISASRVLLKFVKS